MVLTSPNECTFLELASHLNTILDLAPHIHTYGFGIGVRIGHTFLAFLSVYIYDKLIFSIIS